MGIFDDLVAAKGTGTVFDTLKPLDEAALERERSTNFVPPPDYLAFLEEVGCGAFSTDTFNLYGGLIEPNDVYGWHPVLPEDLLLFGDDMAGYCVGFRSGDSRVYELNPRATEIDVVAESFAPFIRGRIAEVS